MTKPSLGGFPKLLSHVCTENSEDSEGSEQVTSDSWLQVAQSARGRHTEEEVAKVMATASRAKQHNRWAAWRVARASQALRLDAH